MSWNLLGSLTCVSDSDSRQVRLTTGAHCQIIIRLTSSSCNHCSLLVSCTYFIYIAEVLVSPDADAHGIVARLESEHDSACESLEKSLAAAGNMYGMVTKQQFMEWAELTAPQISSTLSTFMHNLLFHGKWLKHRLNFVPFEYPKLDQKSDIFEGVHPPNLFALACASPQMGGKWHNLYSFEFHGHSMNRLQVILL